MKLIVIALVTLFSLSSFASLDKTSVKTLLSYKTVAAKVKEMKKDGLELSAIEDVNATAGVAPRCPCASYKLTFSGFQKTARIVSVNVDLLKKEATVSK